MNMKKFSVVFVAALWAVLTAFAWFGPRQELSEAERRPLAQMPELSGKTLLSGSFMEDFEDFTLDQFPLRDGFRTIKSLFHQGEYTIIENYVYVLRLIKDTYSSMPIFRPNFASRSACQYIYIGTITEYDRLRMRFSYCV